MSVERSEEETIVNTLYLRVCNALALLQCVASHPETRLLFLNGKLMSHFVSVFMFAHVLLFHTAHIPLYLYPFLNTTSKTRPFEYLRLTSLGVIGALVKVNYTSLLCSLLVVVLLLC
jgi:CCR4-NOT transcription complex subunit 9